MKNLSRKIEFRSWEIVYSSPAYPGFVVTNCTTNIVTDIQRTLPAKDNEINDISIKRIKRFNNMKTYTDYWEWSIAILAIILLINNGWLLYIGPPLPGILRTIYILGICNTFVATYLYFYKKKQKQ